MINNNMISILQNLFCFGMNMMKVKPKWRTVMMFIMFLFDSCAKADDYNRQPSISFYEAVVNITYKDPVTGHYRTEKDEIGRYGQNSRLDNEWGTVVHVRTLDNATNGCAPPINVPKERWIALVERGGCKFTRKITNAAVIRNASAVVIYNHVEGEGVLTMDHKVDDVVSIFISKSDGERIARLVDNGTRVLMHISVGRHKTSSYSNINKTSVLFVSISFIVLMIISLAWLVFYYIQRFRYAHAKERLSKRLMNAAKKAITKMPLRTVRNGDRETDSDYDQCAVCIESYRASDVIRILPCKHVFHKSCVDPWLIEQRSCPMCKLDILKAYGLQVQGSRESVHIDFEGASTSIGPSDMLHGRTSSHIDDGASAAVEMVGLQPAHAQVEYHHHQDPPDYPSPPTSPDVPSCTVTFEEVDVERQPLQKTTSDESQSKVSAAESMESVRSTDSDANELQSLMPKTEQDCCSDHDDEDATS